MSYERINVQLAIKLPLPELLFQKPTQAQLTALADMSWLQIIKTMIRKFRDYSEKINAGSINEEDTLIAKRHECTHDEDPIEQCVEEDI